MSPFILATISPSLFKIVKGCDDEHEQVLLVVFKFALVVLTSLLLLQLSKKLHLETIQNRNADINAIIPKTTETIIKLVFPVIAEININTEKNNNPINIGEFTNFWRNIATIIVKNIRAKIKCRKDGKSS